MKCFNCHNDIHAHKLEDLIVVDDHFYCKDCSNHHLYVCSECGKHFEKDNIIVTSEFSKIGYCYSCVEKNNVVIKRCHHCHDPYIFKHASFSFALKLFQSNICGSNWRFPELYCERCGEHICNCESCHNIKMDGHYYCEDHIGLEKIKKYSYKPEYNFYKGSNEKDLYIGVEFEINFEDAESLSKFLNNINSNFFYFKHDGSLGTYGVEIISQPATIQYHIYSKEWENLFNELNKYKTNTKGCGIHFHISRDALNNIVIRNIDFFVNHYADEIAKIGSRFYNCYATQSASFVRIYQHYDACNLSNTNTVELRFCASTHNYKTFMNKLKNIYIIIMYCFNHFVEPVNYDAFNKFKQDIMSRI